MEPEEPFEPSPARPPLRRRLVRNISWTFGGQMWSIAATFLATPFIVRGLGADGYGVLATLGVVTNYVWFMDLGLGAATVKYVAEFASREEWEDVSRVFWTSLAGYVVLGLLAAVVMAVLAPLCVYRWFQIPTALQADALTAFYLSAVGIFLGLLNYGPSSLIRGLQRFDLMNQVNMVMATAQPLLSVGLLALGYSLPAVVAANVGITALSLVVNTVLVIRLLPRLGAPVWDTPTFRKLVHFGGFITASSLIVPLLVSLEKLVLANQVSIAAVAYYMVPHSLATRLAVIPSSFSSVLFPAFSSLNGTGDEGRQMELNLRANRAILLLFFPPLLVLLLFGRQFLTLWMGAEFASHAATALQILLLATFIHAFAWTPHSLIQAMGRPDVTLRIYLIEAAICIPATLVVVARWGVEGAALAWLIRVTLDTALVWMAAARVMGVERFRFGVIADRKLLMMLAGGGALWLGRGVFEGAFTPLNLGLSLAGLAAMILGGSGPLTEELRYLLPGRFGGR